MQQKVCPEELRTAHHLVSGAIARTAMADTNNPRSVTANPAIQLLVFAGCPLAAPARESLEKALAELEIPGYEEIDILGAGASDELQGWGSPTILVNGEDVTGAPKGNRFGCRVYPGSDRVPSPSAIVEGIRKQKPVTAKETPPKRRAIWAGTVTQRTNA